MKNYFLPLGILLLAGVASRPALADSFYLEGTNSTSGAPCSTTVPCAEVTITSLGSNLFRFTVSSLDSGYIFDTFGFNGPAGVTLDTATGFAPSGEVGSGANLGGSGNEDGWGSFAYNFDTGESGGANSGQCVVTSGMPGSGCTFTFVVQATGSGVTDASFEIASSGSGGAQTGDFAGHIATSDNSGYVGFSVPVQTSTSPTPEPSSLMLLGTGALGLAGVIRRRYRR